MSSPRLFTTLLAAALCAAHAPAAESLSPPTSGANVPNLPPIDRQALASRHNPVLKTFDVEAPLSVGNGGFAFTVDATGLQTFPQAFLQTIPLCTMSDWGWHSFPNPNGWTIDKFAFREYNSHGRMVPYAEIVGRSANAPADQRTQGANSGSAENNYLRENPHRLNLGQLGFVLTKADGTFATPADITNIEQTLDLWNGVINSKFTFEGQPVTVQTVCDPVGDAIAVRVQSPLVRSGQLKVQIAFPYGAPGKAASDWNKPDAHTTTAATSGNGATFTRQLDGTTYIVAATWSPGATLADGVKHQYVVTPDKSSDVFELACGFLPAAGGPAPAAFPATLTAAQTHWNKFWSTGGALDLSLSKDPRWKELERRIVLSEYLTAIQCAGDTPPQETGLTYNSWNGKFHLEMHWWHSLQFALWDRLSLFEKSLGYYVDILPRAKGTAVRQGYKGARWPKMTDPSGAESPSSVGPFLIWQQPHPVYYAEMVYRQKPTPETLAKFKDVVDQTAEFMADYAWWDAATNRYVLGPPLQGAQEIFPKGTMMNPTFEIAYWRWGLETAQKWRERQGQPRVEKWDHVIKNLPALPVEDDKYLFAETATGTYTQPKQASGHPLWADDHPSVVAIAGFLPPTEAVDLPRMKRTLNWIAANWNFPDTWGWDYGMLAMCAARVGEPAKAVDFLLLDTPKNIYRANGHNHQRMPDLPIYLPGNGSLLAAAAMMAAGWDGGPSAPAPGFPADGSWVVRWENLRKLP